MSDPGERTTVLTPGRMLVNGVICLVAAAVMTVLAVDGANGSRPFAVVAAVLAAVLGAGAVLAAARIRHARRHPDSAAARRVAETERLTPPPPARRERTLWFALVGAMVALVVLRQLEGIPEPVRVAMAVLYPIVLVALGVIGVRRLRSDLRWRRDRMAE
ncbi:hypothetical protein [Nocardioides zeae]|uniref:Uncharacterized protein n=1 Tax=Nocardioides zeae TaxID=1457234 RepID=A0A6P0HMT5_9ACTN|nr:hypothetical protein [Nocardioides zeae]NEN79916.1 hypothetical protein [Nocardioides zeae]